MAYETIVAVFDTESHAEAAVRDLIAAGIPSSAISRETSAGHLEYGQDLAAAQPREQGFWSSLFGGEPDHDSAVYDRTLESGSHVVTVKVSEDHVANVTSILEGHHPIDLDERAASYGLGATTTTTTTTTAAAPIGGMAAGTTAAKGLHGDAETLQLAEEQLTVGKRLVNKGTTRIRRFVVETPVEENVSLHSENVSIERRPVTGDTRAVGAEFTDRVIELTETDEEAVIAKTARVKEEVVIRKGGADRVETVRDTVRREDVEITKDTADTLTKDALTTGVGVKHDTAVGTSNPLAPETIPATHR